jgi:hypothetical protein
MVMALVNPRVVRSSGRSLIALGCTECVRIRLLVGLAASESRPIAPSRKSFKAPYRLTIEPSRRILSAVSRPIGQLWCKRMHGTSGDRLLALGCAVTEQRTKSQLHMTKREVGKISDSLCSFQDCAKQI